MITTKNINLIVVADDDSDDRMLIMEAFEENNLNCPLCFVEDGLELLDLLFQKGKYAGAEGSNLPDLIILDINMPKKNGKDALIEIRNNPKTKHIPILMFSTSNAVDEIAHTYRLGANSFIIKPSSYSGFVEVTKNIQSYWVDTVSVSRIVNH